MLNYLRKEQQTWQLVSSLYHDRFDSHTHSGVSDFVMADNSVSLVESYLRRSFLSRLLL